MSSLAPLFCAGAVNDTTSPVDGAGDPGTSVTAVGGFGEPTASGDDAAERAPAPRAFVAFTVQV